MMKKQTLFLWVAWLALGLPTQDGLAQGTRSDYDRAAKLRDTTANKVFKQTVKPHWLTGNTRFWYRNDLVGGAREFVLVDAVKGERTLAFDHAKLAAALAKATGKEIKADRLPVDNIDLGSEGNLFLGSDGKWWLCDLQSYELRPTNRNDRASSSLRVETVARPSRRTGEETSITFLNRTRDEAITYWMTEEGERRRYATVKAGEQFQQHTFAGHVWLAADAKGKTLGVFEAVEGAAQALLEETREARPAEPERPRARKRSGYESPDGKWAAFFKEHNLWARDVKTGEEVQLSKDGQTDDAYAGDTFWSPDSAHLVALRTKKGDERKVYIIESSPKDQLQPKLHNYDYLKPGDKIPLSKPQLFDLTARKQIPVSDELFPNPWSISDVRWAPDSKRFTFLYNQRGHQVLRVVAVEAGTGAARAIVDEQSKTFVDYSGKLFSRYLDDTGEIIWMSERDGWNHLYLFDAATGQVKNQITKGQWVVREVDRVDEKTRQIWFRAGGLRPGQDPYYVHRCRINFDGTGLVTLTEGEGTHAVEFSPDRAFLIDTWSRVDQPPAIDLHRANDGQRVCELERADWSELLKTGWRAPERFVAKARDGQTDIYGIIIRPSNFDPAKKYPVIEEIYAGPQGAFVPKGFGLETRQHAIAELGFIVVQIDGMGTSYRSKAFHDVCWKNLGDSGFPERIAWMKAAAAKYPSMDLTRVGIYGGSAGGQSSTRALLAHGDFYKVAVSDCGCHDNRMDKIWWNEQWMGWPIGPHYAEQSNVTQAHKLQGKLMLVVGELDRNVDPASTMQVANALIKADKDFDLLIIPGAGHGCAESPYGSRRRMDFFVRHLLGVEPRSGL
jgi:dipeptidyl-peptidase 4